MGVKRISTKDTTLVQYLARLEQTLTDLMKLEVLHKQEQKLVRAIKKCRGDLFVFMTRRDVPYTNNGSERALRMSVIFRKVTGCFRSAWGSQFYAATISVIATGKLHGKTALEAIRQVIANPKEPALAS
jgi:transposase